MNAAVNIPSMTTPRVDISGMSPAERLKLAEELWDSLSPADVPLTPAQVVELERREAHYRTHGSAGRPWREVLDEIQRRRG